MKNVNSFLNKYPEVSDELGAAITLGELEGWIIVHSEVDMHNIGLTDKLEFIRHEPRAAIQFYIGRKNFPFKEICTRVYYGGIQTNPSGETKSKELIKELQLLL